QLAGVVVHELLQQRTADTLGEPAVEHAAHDTGVHSHAAVVDHGVFENVDLARAAIDLDHAQVNGSRGGDAVVRTALLIRQLVVGWRVPDVGCLRIAIHSLRQPVRTRQHEHDDLQQRYGFLGSAAHSQMSVE